MQNTEQEVADFLNKLLPFLDFGEGDDRSTLMHRLLEVTKICTEFASRVRELA